MDFLREVTDIFPLSKYDIKIVQHIYSHSKPHVSLYLDIRDKKTCERVFCAEPALLADGDYDYVRDILIKEAPQYEWQTAEEYLRDRIGGYMGDPGVELISDRASDLLVQMVLRRWKEVKRRGFVDFDDEMAVQMARDILEELLGEICENQDMVCRSEDKGSDGMTLCSVIHDSAVRKYDTEQFQRSLADDCNMSNATISRIMAEDGIHPDTATLRKIADCLNIDTLLLLYLNGDITKGEYARLR